MIELKNRFVSLWQRHSYVESGDSPIVVFNELVAMYKEIWRSYHNLEHIQSSLVYFDDCKNHANFPDAIEFSIWFHDCIYVLGAADNESKSKDWFLKKTREQLVPALRNTAGKLIMDTGHINMPDSDDGKLISDIDLTSFGLPWDEYMKDSLAVQSEFAPQPNDSATNGKITFLENLIKNGQIYYSDYYLQNYEKKAQQNIRQHLAFLNKQ